MTEMSLRSTIQLVRDLLKFIRAFEGITINPTPLRHPYWWVLSKVKFLGGVKKRRESELSNQLIDTMGELVDRYDGILFQLFSSPGAFTSVGTQGIDEKLERIWYKLQHAATTMQNHRDFSITLWMIYLRHGNEISELKPKFMLRQFVDEMPAGDERGALRSQAYKRQATLSTDDHEVAKMVYRAYPILHEQVLDFSSDLLRLTGETLKPEEIAILKPPYMRYHDWLFPQL